MPDYDLGTARGRIELDASSLGRASAAFGVLGKSMIGLGAVAVGAFAYAVKSAADFEKIMSAVQAVTNGTEEQMDQLSRTALDMATETIYSADEIAEGMHNLGKAGITIDDMMGGAVQATIDLAAAAGDELPGGIDRAAEVIANAAKTFDAGAEDLQHFADVLVGAAAASTTSVDDLAVSMRYVGPIAAALGVDIDSLGATLALLGDRGIRGSTAGTSLRGVLIALSPQSKKAQKEMKKLGLITEDGANKFFDLEGNMKPLPDIMQTLQDATKDLTQEEKVAAFNTIFRRRAMASALIMAEQGAEGFENYADAMGELTAADIAATKLDNLSGDFLILRQTIDSLVTGVGLHFQDMMRSWVQGLTDVVDWLRSLDEELLAQILLYGAIAGAIFIALGAFALMIAGVINMYRQFALLAEGIRLVLGAFKLLSVSFLLSPWTLLAGVIAGVIYMLYRAYQSGGEFTEIWDNWWESLERLQRWLLPFFRNLISAVDDLVSLFSSGEASAEEFASILDGAFGGSGKYTSFFEDLYNGIANVFGAIRDFATGIADWFVDAVGGLENALLILGAIVLGLISPWLGLAAGIALAYTKLGWFRDAVDGVWQGLQTLWDTISDLGVSAWHGFQQFLDWLGTNVGPIFTAAGEAISAFWNFIYPFFGVFVALAQGAWNIFLEIIRFVVDAALRFWALFGDNIVSLFQIAWDFVVGILEGAFQIIQGILQVFAGIFTGDWGKIWEGAKNIASGAWQIIVTIVRTGRDLLVNLVQTLADTIHFLWDTLWSLVVTAFRVAWESIKTIAKAAWQFLVAAFNGFKDTLWKLHTEAMDAIGRVWRSAWDAIMSFFAGILGTILQTAIDKIDEIVAWFQGLPTRVMDGVRSLQDLLVGFFRTALGQTLLGIGEKGIEILNWFRDLPGKVIAKLGNVGSLLYNIGKDLIQGMINGVKSMVGALADAVGGAIGGAVDRGKNILGIGSPSKVFHEIGEWTGEGFVQGMAAMIRQASMMGEQLAGAAIPASLGASGNASSTTTDNSSRMVIENLTVQARDLQEADSVQALFESLSDAALQGVNRHG